MQMNFRQWLASVAVATTAAAAAFADGAGLCVEDGDRVAFLGDSITQFGKSPDGYVSLTVKGLALLGVNVESIPSGKRGNKSNDMLMRMDKDVISKKPQWMTLSCGVNDVWHGTNGVPLVQFKENIRAILDKCKDAGIKVIVLTPTMLAEDVDNPLNKQLEPYNEFLRAEAATRGLVLADMNAAQREEYKSIRATDTFDRFPLTKHDGVHMSFRGNCMLAWTLLKAIGVPEDQKDAMYAEFFKYGRKW